MLSLTSLLQSIGIKLDANDIINVLVFNLDESWGSIANLLLACDELTIEDTKGILQNAEGHCGGVLASSDTSNFALLAHVSGGRGRQWNSNGGGVQSSKVVCW
jgi:hypothetical protein